MVVRRTVSLALCLFCLGSGGTAPLFAGSCPSGEVASGAEFADTIRPARALYVNPDPGFVEVYLTAQESTWDFGLGAQTTVWTYNGQIPGPTLEVEVGDTLIVHLCNDLPESTTIHWHGVETPADMDGSHISQLTVPPGGTFRYEFSLLRAGTYWYHPHVRTHRSVERGLYGALIVRDPVEDAALGLPTREHLWIFDDLSLEPDGTIREPFVGSKEEVALEMLNGREGNLRLLNGKTEPALSLEEGVPHRVRVLNAASARFLRVSVPDHTFWRIGGDQGLIETAIEVPPAASTVSGLSPSGAPLKHPSDPDPATGLLLTPGERADIVFVPVKPEGTSFLHLEWHDLQRGRHSVEFHEDGTVSLAHDVPDGTRSFEVYAVIQLTAPPDGEAMVTTYDPPPSLRDLEPIAAAGAPTLELTLGHTVPDWNTGEITAFIQEVGKSFAVLGHGDVYSVESGKTYVWGIKNLTGSHHNFHTHGWSFQHLETRFVDLDDPTNPDRNYVTAATHLEDKDTILIPRRPGTVPGRSFSLTRLAARFGDAGREGQVAADGKTVRDGRSGGWLAHCHILEHAARGMSTIFQVTDLFVDSFESGDLSAWSSHTPALDSGALRFVGEELRLKPSSGEDDSRCEPGHF